jgi:hypothetical protein
LAMVLLLDQELADLMQLTDRLLLDRLDGDMAHGRPGHRLANGLSIGCIVLVTLDLGPDVPGWDQADLVPQLVQLTAPSAAALPIRSAPRHRPAHAGR